jgi:hypothetical protein
LAGATPEEAVDGFLDLVRDTLDCILAGAAFGSGDAVGIEHSLTLYSPGQDEPNVARLLTHGGVGEILFRFALLYTVVHVPDASRRDAFQIRTLFYQYAILDFAETEIVVYDWALAGISPVRRPHLHFPVARAIHLQQRHGDTQKTYLGNLHFPTGRIALEDIVELLIREFHVDPRRADWEAVLARNREAAGSGEA